MKVTFNTQELQRRLAQLGGVVAKKATLDVFKHVLVEAQMGTPVTVKAMDIDATLTVTLNKATADGTVKVLLPYAKLNEIVANVTAAETVITVNAAADRATISAGRGVVEGVLETHPLENLTSDLERPAASKAIIGLPGFKEQIASIIYVISEGKDAKFAPSVAKLESTSDTPEKKGALKLIATDGFRLVVSTVEQSAGDFNLTLPKPALEKISHLEGGPTGNLTIADVDAGFWFYTDTEVLTVNRTAGEFPPYERIIALAGTESVITIPSTAEFISLIRQNKPSADNEKPVLTFTAKDGVLIAEAATTKQATARPEEKMRFASYGNMDAASTAPCDFSLDVVMLLPFLEQVSETPLTINWKTSIGIVDFHGGNGKVRFLQMPTNPNTRN